MSIDALIALKRRYSDHLLRIPGVLGVAVTVRDDGSTGRRSSIELYVEDLFVAASLRGAPLIEALRGLLERQGWSLQTRIIGAFAASALPGRSGEGATPSQERVRPVQPGCSIGTTGPGGAGSTGTGGLVVRDASGAPFLLSNAHVLNLGDDTGCAAVCQPGPRDLGAASVASCRVGELDRSIALRRWQANLLDVALVRMDEGVELDARYPEVGPIVGISTHFGEALRVLKVGRSTGGVTGRVQAIDADIVVDYGPRGRRRSMLFRRQVLFVADGDEPRCVQDEGDSGAVWVTREGLASALSFAASADGTLSVATPFLWVAQVLGLSEPSAEPLLLARAEGRWVEADAQVGPLDDDTVERLRALLLVAGQADEEPTDPEHAVQARVGWLRHPKLPNLSLADLYFGRGTQLTGGASGFASYELRVGSGSSFVPFAKVVAVSSPDQASPPASQWAGTFPQPGEYWFIDPIAAYGLTSTSNQVSICTNYQGSWSGISTAENTWITSALQMPGRMTPSLLNIETASWGAVSSSLSAWGGALEYSIGNSQTNTQHFGVSFDLVSGTLNGQNCAAITCVNWFRFPVSGVIAPLFDGVVGSTCAGAAAFGWHTLAWIDGSATWASWPPPRSS